MTVVKTPTFNLTREAWIPCVGARGEPEHLSLREVMARAPELRDVAIASPIARVAMYRLLLAILYRVHGVETQEEWDGLAGANWEADPVLRYFERFENRFDLFSESAPFFQLPDLDTGGRTPVTKLTHEYAAGGNKQLLDHSSDDDPPTLTAAEAARALLVAQAWSIGGGKSGGGRPNFTSAPLGRGACIVPLGKDLAETLLANLVPRVHLEAGARRMPDGANWKQDLPLWERERPLSQMTEERGLTGICDYLTWPVRYVRLIPERDGTVRFMHYAQGEKCPDLVDMHHAFRTDAKTGASIPAGIRKDRAAWRDAESLFAHIRDQTKKTSVPLGFLRTADAQPLGRMTLQPVMVAGIAVPNGQPPPDRWCADVFRIPQDLVTSQTRYDEMVSALDLAKDVAKAFRDAVSVYAKTFLKTATRPPDPAAVKEFTESLCRELYFWAALEAPFHEFLAALAQEGDEARAQRNDAWAKTVRRAAIAAFEASLASQDRTGRHWKARNAATGAFWSGMKGLASIIPNSTPPKEEASDDYGDEDR